MSADLVTYNGYRFNEYSEITVNGTIQPDDSQRTTLFTRWLVRVETTIYADENDTEGQAGEHFERIRDRLSKQGQYMRIHHQGFGVDFEVNSPTPNSPKDLAFGPKPRVISWEPIGEVNAVEVVWECEVCISPCNRWSGLMSLNFGVYYRIDKAGYTTRTISGHLEIALNRTTTRRLSDNIDDYRDRVILENLPNFERETSWSVSLDKRRADFSITDSQVRSPNEYPAGVISIRASHSANWSRRLSVSQIPQTIRASIELAQGQPRSRAIEIFKAIADSRVAYATEAGNWFVEELLIEEEIFGNTFNFSISYRLYLKEPFVGLSALKSFFAATGLGQPTNLGTWEQWKASVAGLQSHRGGAQLRMDHRHEQIIDMCSDVIVESKSTSGRIPYTPPRAVPNLYNKKPPPKESYLEYESWIETDESIPTTIQISVGKDDLKLSENEFDPSNPLATLGNKDTSAQVARIVESQAGRIEVVFKGYAERVGYPIPRPDKIKLGDNITLTRIGKARFIQQFKGNVLGQPVYAAAWNQRYVVSQRPVKLETKDIDEWEGR